MNRKLKILLPLTVLALAACQAEREASLWEVYDASLKSAKYIDLTHAFEPEQAVWPGFANVTFKPAIAGDSRQWEDKHGRIPVDSVVMVSFDWSKGWNDVARFNQKSFPGVGRDALKFLHGETNILFHGHEPLYTDTTPTLEGEHWLMHNNVAQAEGVANLDKVPETGALIAIGFAKPLGGT